MVHAREIADGRGIRLAVHSTDPQSARALPLAIRTEILLELQVTNRNSRCLSFTLAQRRSTSHRKSRPHLRRQLRSPRMHEPELRRSDRLALRTLHRQTQPTRTLEQARLPERRRRRRQTNRLGVESTPVLLNTGPGLLVDRR